MRNHWTGTGSGAHPKADAASLEVNRRHGTAFEHRLGTRSDQWTLGSPNRGKTGDGAQMDGQSGTSRVVHAGRVDE